MPTSKQPESKPGTVIGTTNTEEGKSEHSIAPKPIESTWPFWAEVQSNNDSHPPAFTQETADAFNAEVENRVKQRIARNLTTLTAFFPRITNWTRFDDILRELAYQDSRFPAAEHVLERWPPETDIDPDALDEFSNEFRAVHRGILDAVLRASEDLLNRLPEATRPCFRDDLSTFVYKEILDGLRTERRRPRRMY
jgi:hypothetical protein